MMTNASVMRAIKNSTSSYQVTYIGPTCRASTSPLQSIREGKRFTLPCGFTEEATATVTFFKVGRPTGTVSDSDKRRAFVPCAYYITRMIHCQSAFFKKIPQKL